MAMHRTQKRVRNLMTEGEGDHNLLQNMQNQNRPRIQLGGTLNLNFLMTATNFNQHDCYSLLHMVSVFFATPDS